jgi:membrane protein YqaA with SNARE-associated domain
MAWLALTLAVGFVSSVVPVLNTELFVAGLMVERPGVAWWLIGIAAAVGQVTGKLLYYYAGRGGVNLPQRLRKSANGKGRWKRCVSMFRQWCRTKPLYSAAIMSSSAVVGVPPIAATSIAAGAGTVSLRWFVGITLPGRALRFAAIAAAPALVVGWLP